VAQEAHCRIIAVVMLRETRSDAELDAMICRMYEAISRSKELIQRTEELLNQSSKFMAHNSGSPWDEASTKV
jgi:hypothetical protein